MTIHYLKKVVNRLTFVCIANLYLAAVSVSWESSRMRSSVPAQPAVNEPLAPGAAGGAVA